MQKLHLNESIGRGDRDFERGREFLADAAPLTKNIKALLEALAIPNEAVRGKFQSAL